MDEFIKEMKKSWLGRQIVSRMDELITWIGIVGFIATPVLPTSWVMAGFVALIFLPDGRFSDIFKKWTSKIRGL